MLKLHVALYIRINLFSFTNIAIDVLYDSYELWTQYIMLSDHIATGAYDDKCNSCNMYVGNKGDAGEPGERGDAGDRGPRGLLDAFVVATS